MKYNNKTRYQYSAIYIKDFLLQKYNCLTNLLAVNNNDIKKWLQGKQLMQQGLLLLFFFGLGPAVSAATQPFKEGKHYTTVQQPLTTGPQILEFFSFYCGHCYAFDEKFKLLEKLAKVLPANTTIKRYHVSFLGPLGKQLTEAWAIAMALDMEEPIRKALFSAIQKTQSLRTPQEIAAIFLQAGLSQEAYSAAQNSFSVQALIVQQEKAAQQLQLRGVPALFVNGKYMINNNSLNTTSDEVYLNEYLALIQFLLK